MGVERLVLLLEELQVLPKDLARFADVYIVAAGEGTDMLAFEIAQQLREIPNMRVVQNMGGGSFKSQMKKADKSGAAYAVIIGSEEIAEQSALLKPLLNSQPQIKLPMHELNAHLSALF
jgi:histidyl-tRNA synthetase